MYHVWGDYVKLHAAIRSGLNGDIHVLGSGGGIFWISAFWKFKMETVS
jgi:hypothetical protein